MDQIQSWLEPIRARIPPDLPLAEVARLQEAIMGEALSRFGAFLEGVKAYQSSPVERPEMDVPCLWQRGTTRLLDYGPGGGQVVLIIPSLVNRFDILDIDVDFSFLRYLTAQGLRPIVVDWGLPGTEERGFDLATYMRERLWPALDEAGARAGGACDVLGYCMGGVMALALAAMRPAQVRSLALMATPWDFSAGVGGVPGAQTSLGALFMQQAMSAEAYLEKVGYLPAAMLQNVFTSYQPLQVLQKFMRFADGEEGGDGARRFVLTEDWLNDGVPLALPVARETLRDWYGANLTARNQWALNGVRIDPARIDCPAYVLVADRDRIVPPESTQPLVDRLARPVLHRVPLGHIGLMASDGAPQQVWAPLAAWLKETK